ncbi:hypothetical protein [Nocardioides sp. NPDC047086]|uniref:hypothetical protein n=1 Tax=Nocardioides sp. NPDC047086 TaxID=3154810 RepID=UPI0033F37718
MTTHTTNASTETTAHMSGIEPVLSLTELCEHLHVPAQTIYDLRQPGSRSSGIPGRPLRAAGNRPSLPALTPPATPGDSRMPLPLPPRPPAAARHADANDGDPL